MRAVFNTPLRSFSHCAMLLAALGLAFAAHAQEKSMYRYTDADGRVVYSDRAPPPDAKNSQLQRAGGNFIETDKMSASTRQAMERFPVTLYASSCGVLCEDAERLLQKRGVPYSFVNTQEKEGAEKLKKLTGALDIPALQVGTDFAKGFQEATWQQMLDKGGYSSNAGVKPSALHTAPAPAVTKKPPAQNGDGNDAPAAQ